MTNNNTDQEKQWREDFEALFKLDRVSVSAQRHPHNEGAYIYEYGRIKEQDLWGMYLSTRRHAQVEVDNVRDYLRDKLDEIQKLREQLEENRLITLDEDMLAETTILNLGITVDQLREQNKTAVNSLGYYKGLFTDSRAEIQELKLELQKERECVEFYAGKGSFTEGTIYPWCGSLELSRIWGEDIQNMGSFSMGGKRARETIKNRKVL